MFLSSLIVFCLVIAFTNRRHKKMIEKYEKEFWDREARANNTRKKSLTNLTYISLPDYLLPEDFMPEDDEVSALFETLKELSGQNRQSDRLYQHRFKAGIWHCQYNLSFRIRPELYASCALSATAG